MYLISNSGHDFNILIAPLRTELVNYASKIARWDSEAAEDVVQDALISAWKRWGQWAPSHEDAPDASARAWMYRIVANKIVTLIRKNSAKKRTQQVYEHEMVELGRVTGVASYDTGDPSAPKKFGLSSPAPARGLAENQDLHPVVQAAVSRLHPDRQAVIELHYLRDNDSTEISEKLGIPSSTVRTRLVRAHDRLRPILRRYAREEYYLRAAGVETNGETTEVMETDTDSVDAIVRDDDSAPLYSVEPSPDLASAG